MKLKENQAVLILERTENGGMLISVDSGSLNDTLGSQICTVIGEKFADDQDFQEQILSCIDGNDEEIQEIRRKPFQVKEFPIFHHFFTTLLIRQKIADNDYEELFEHVGEHEVLDYSASTLKVYASVLMKRDMSNTDLKEDDGFFQYYNNGIVSLRLFTDGHIELDCVGYFPYLYPYSAEVPDVLSGNKTTYTEGDPQSCVDYFFEHFIPVDADDVLTYVTD